ncbi:hypothetical protein TYRP_009838 [Tyrophagus putrescentiae]|nr:hypothetical protein TYRP_009838 [Tyrophagus putrescentiae]
MSLGAAFSPVETVNGTRMKRGNQGAEDVGAEVQPPRVNRQVLLVGILVELNLRAGVGDRLADVRLADALRRRLARRRHPVGAAHGAHGQVIGQVAAVDTGQLRRVLPFGVVPPHRDARHQGRAQVELAGKGRGVGDRGVTTCSKMTAVRGEGGHGDAEEEDEEG